jgi:hypothetical protein
MSARFKACAALAEAVKRAGGGGFKGELGFQAGYSPTVSSAT